MKNLFFFIFFIIFLEEIPKSESFYLNPNYSIQGSQESILSDENNLDYNDFCTGNAKSYCNSLESVLSNESDCKSAPLEVLFEDKKRQVIVCEVRIVF